MSAARPVGGRADRLPFPPPPIRPLPVALEAAIAAAAGAGFGLLAVALVLRAPALAPLAVGAAAAPFLGLVVSPERLLLALAVIDVPLEWDSYLGYRADAADGGAVAGVIISATTLALVGLYALWGVRALASRGGAPRPRVSAPLLAYLGVVAVSLLVASDRGLAANEIALLVQVVLLAIYVGSFVRDTTDVRFLVRILLVSLALESAIMVGLGAGLPGFQAGGIETTVWPGAGGVGPRIGGTVGSPVIAGAFLEVLLPVALAVVLGWRGRDRRLAALALVLGVPALALTQTRGAWIAFTIGMLIVAVVSARSRLLSRGTLLVAGGGLSLVLLPFLALVSNRLTASDGGSAASRVPLLRIALEMIRDHPVLGVGASNFRVAMAPYLTPDFSRDWLYAVHDKYLLVWAETGVLGLAAFVAFLADTLRRGVRVLRMGDAVLTPVALGLTAGIAGQMVHMLFDVFNTRPQLQLLCLAGALLLAMDAMRAQRA